MHMSLVQYRVCHQRSGRHRCCAVAQGHVWLTDPSWGQSAGRMSGTGRVLALEQPWWSLRTLRFEFLNTALPVSALAASMCTHVTAAFTGIPSLCSALHWTEILNFDAAKTIALYFVLSKSSAQAQDHKGVLHLSTSTSLCP